MKSFALFLGLVTLVKVANCEPQFDFNSIVQGVIRDQVQNKVVQVLRDFTKNLKNPFSFELPQSPPLSSSSSDSTSEPEQALTSTTTELTPPSDPTVPKEEVTGGNSSTNLAKTDAEGDCRCVNKERCTGATQRRVSKAVNTSPCRNGGDVMCCSTTGSECGVPATALLVDTNNQVNYGLGIVISWKLVLTTARNVQNLQSDRNERLKVRLGEWDLPSNNEPFGPHEYPVSEIIIHPNFNPRTFQNDIAILRLSNYIDLTAFPSIRSGCIARPGEQTQFIGARCLAAGWGVQPFVEQKQRLPTINNNGNKNTARPIIVGGGGFGQQQQSQFPQPLPPRSIDQEPQQPGQGAVGSPGSGSGQQQRNLLKEVDLEVVEGNQCQDALRRHVGNAQFLLDQKSFVCAGGDTGKGLCKGDEGGALVCKDKRSERYTVIGMASWGTTCGQAGFPVVFTNVANYYDWIKSVDL